MKAFHITLPTNNPKEFKEKFFSSISYFESFKEYFSFGINFQNYSNEDINLIINEFKKYDLDVRYIESKYTFEEGLTPQVRIRSDGALLNPKCKYILMLDDDIFYIQKDRFKILMINCLKYLLKNEDCSVLMLNQNKPFGHILSENYIGRTTVGLGMFIKNIYNGLTVPEKYLNNTSGMEDLFTGYIRLKTTPSFLAVAGCEGIGHHTEIKTFGGATTHKWRSRYLIEGTNSYYLNQFKPLHGYYKMYDYNNYYPNDNVNWKIDFDFDKVKKEVDSLLKLTK